MELRKILLATDFSDCAEHAFRPTADLARRVSAAIDFVHVSDFPPPPGAEIIGVSVAEYNERLRERLEELAQSSVFDGLEIQCHVLDGYGVKTLQRFQEEGGHDLAALATHGRAGFQHLLLGSFTENVVRKLSCPVLAVRGRGEDTVFSPRKILCPYDFSDCSRVVIEPLRYLARTFGSSVHVLHVLFKDLVPAMSFPAAEPGLAQDFGRFWKEAENSARDRLTEFVRAELDGLVVTTETAVDNPVHAIVERSREDAVDLVMMATHGRTGLSHALLGSVAERVVRKAACSTITVRPAAGAC